MYDTERYVTRRERERIQLERAFARARDEVEELRRLKAQYPQWSGLHFKRSTKLAPLELDSTPAAVGMPGAVDTPLANVVARDTTAA